MTPSPNSKIATVLPLLVVALGLRIYGIDWGLPQVYEEATPLRKAWEMWGWGAQEHFDPNPHFFRYPTLTFYIQFLAQGLLYLTMKLRGAIDSTVDFQVAYLLHKTPFFVVGRLITTVFAVASVAVVFAIARRIAGMTAGVLAALFLAVAPFHIARSQVIEVDVPLTFFVLLTIFFALRLIERPTLRRYMLVGLFTGLAISTKYTGAFLVPVVVVAHLFSRRYNDSPGRPLPWTWCLISLAIGAMAFVITSPFVFFDFPTFWQHLAAEREHMRVGHFGFEGTPTWLYYTRSLGAILLGWPIFIFGTLGIVFFAGVRRRPWAIVLSTFAVPYLLTVASWAMQAPRYVLPVEPIFMIFAAASVAELRSLLTSRSVAVAVTVLCGAVLAAPLVAQLPDHLARLKPDPRTLARQWIHQHIPEGSLMLMEIHGPELIGPSELWANEIEVRKRIIASTTPVYAIQMMPMFQVDPERSKTFYELSLYHTVDAVVTSSFVKSRYTKDPDRFPKQVAFYDSLQTGYRQVAQFEWPDGSKPTITIYRNPAQPVPFARRAGVRPPRELTHNENDISGEEGFYYTSLGMNYETFEYPREAVAAYSKALAYPGLRTDLFKSAVFGIARSLVRQGQQASAIQFLDRTAAAAPTPAVQREIQQVRARIANLR